MKKRALTLLLALVLVIGLLPMTARAAELDNGLKYKVYEDHVEITGCPSDAITLVIPAEIDGLPVTAIGKRAFEWKNKLIRIDIPESVTSIGEYAFNYCDALLSIDLPDGVTAIADGTFSLCRSLTKIDIPDGITSIGEGAFLQCSSLTSIDIPDSVTSIGDSAFSGCSNLASIHTPNKLISIGDMAFRECSKLKTFDIPDSVTSIGEQAFYWCSSLTSIDIPDGVTSISDSTFSNCTSLTSINIPDSVTVIGENAFYACRALRSIDLPDQILSIGDFTFSNCISLASIDLPDSLASIGEFVFDGCSSLTSIELPDELIFIGSYAFIDCTSLTSITIPGNVSMIESQAFSQCDNLTSIYFEGDAPGFGNNVFLRVTATAYYPAGNPTWTEDVMQDYSGDITWVPYNPNNPFTDVPYGAYYEAPVLWALTNGITTGASATSFNPGSDCLRAQVVTFLHRAEGNPAPASTKNPFTDVTPSDYFYAPVLWAVEKGITNGVSKTEFGARNVCSRAAVVTFLWRAAGSPAPKSTHNPFSDVPADSFYEDAVLWAVENGITTGTSATKFSPTKSCNRAQVVTFLYRAYN